MFFEPNLVHSSQTDTTNPAPLTRVFAAKLDGRVTHVRDAIAVLLVAQVHAVGVPVAAPAHGDAQAIHAALVLIGVTTARRTSGCRERENGEIHLGVSKGGREREWRDTCKE